MFKHMQQAEFVNKIKCKNENVQNIVKPANHLI